MKKSSRFFGRSLAFMYFCKHLYNIFICKTVTMDLKIVKVKCPSCGAELTTKENVLAGMLAKNAIAPCRVCKKQSPIKDFIRVSDGLPLGGAPQAPDPAPQPQPQPTPQPQPIPQPQPQPTPQQFVQTPPPVQPQQPEFVQPQAPQPQQYVQTPPPVQPQYAQPQQPEFAQPQQPQYAQPQQPQYAQPQQPQYAQPTANVKVGLLKVIQAGHRLQLNPGQNIIGRKVQNPPHADIEIEAPTNRMSRQHLIIDVRMEPGKGYVHYVSLYKERVNPTSVDDTPLNYGDRLTLESGSIIHLPDVDLRFEIPGF